MVGGDGVGSDGASDNEVDDGGDGDGNSEGNDDDYQVIAMTVLRQHGLRIIIIIHCDVGDGVVVGVEVEVGDGGDHGGNTESGGDGDQLKTLIIPRFRTLRFNQK